MDPIIAPVIATHGFAGAVALLSFWCAAALRKGSPRHRLAGRVHLWAMLAVLATAVPLALHHLLQGRGAWAAFFAYLAVLLATSTWTGWRAVRDRGDMARYLGPVYRVLEVLNPLTAAAVLAIGLGRGMPLLAGFSVVGFLVGFDLWKRRREIPHERSWWVREHYGAMVGNGIAAHTAFLAIGVPRLLPALADGPAYYLAWFAPLAVGIAVRIWLDRRHARGGMRVRAVAGRLEVA